MEVDVVIVGGGPAGCSAALALCAKGHSVAVINSPSRREKPTETATPALRQLLHSLDADKALSACEPCFGIWSNWGRALPAFRPSLVNPFGHAWFIYRSRFDRCLQQVARDGGAIWIETKAVAVDFDEQSASITTSDTLVRGQWLIMATGSPSWSARTTHQTLSVVDSLIAYWACLPTRIEERVLIVEATDCGWWYLCPSEDGGSIACFVTDAVSARVLRTSQIRNWNELFNATALSRWLDNRTPATSVRVAPTGVAALPRTCGARWITAGDAAAQLDPIGSSGVPTALQSGRLAALSVSEALENNASAIDYHGRWTTNLLEAFVRQRERHYAIEASLRTSSFWAARLRHAA